MSSRTAVEPSPSSAIRIFLIADIRGYTRFTDEFGDEAASRLASVFAQIVAEAMAAWGGQLVELRGDEALCTFESPRASLRCAIELQQTFAEEAVQSDDLPLRVGMGLDVGEAVPVGDGFRGAALNIAARLCAGAAASVPVEPVPAHSGHGSGYRGSRLDVRGNRGAPGLAGRKGLSTRTFVSIGCVRSPSVERAKHGLVLFARRRVVQCPLQDRLQLNTIHYGEVGEAVVSVRGGRADGSRVVGAPLRDVKRWAWAVARRQEHHCQGEDGAGPHLGSLVSN